MNTSMISNTDSIPSAGLSNKAKSAFTPVLQKPTAQRYSPVNIFEPSPVQRYLFMSVLAQQHQDGKSTIVPKVLPSPMSKVTPSQYLRVGNCQDLLTSNIMRCESFQLQQFLVPAPKSFSLDVMLPNKS